MKKWYICQIPTTAPQNDLSLLKELQRYADINHALATSVIFTFLRHTWYLSEVMVGLSFFHTNITYEEKSLMVSALHKTSDESKTIKGHIEMKNITNMNISDIVSAQTANFFDIVLKTRSPSFLNENPRTWNFNPCYIAAENKVKKIMVLNDSAERGI